MNVPIIFWRIILIALISIVSWMFVLISLYILNGAVFKLRLKVGKWNVELDIELPLLVSKIISIFFHTVWFDSYLTNIPIYFFITLL